MDPRVFDAMKPYFLEIYGNAASKSHAFGWAAEEAVDYARGQVASLIGASEKEIIFTSGATESNNLSLLGLMEHGVRTNRKHIVSTEIEHSAVLEPLRLLSEAGFEITRIRPEASGAVSFSRILSAVRSDTLAVSVMQINNETGIRQPIKEIASGLTDEEVVFHVDAAQGASMEFETIQHPRIDLISVSGHKMYGPKGVGALICKRDRGAQGKLRPLMVGGGQELGLRPGTVPVHLVSGLGAACESSINKGVDRLQANIRFRNLLLGALQPLKPITNGDQNLCVGHIISVRFDSIDAEDAIEAAGKIAAFSNGSACTSSQRVCSHVLSAMGLTAEQAAGAMRFSWCHLTPEPDWNDLRVALASVEEDAFHAA